MYVVHKLKEGDTVNFFDKIVAVSSNMFLTLPSMDAETVQINFGNKNKRLGYIFLPKSLRRLYMVPMAMEL